MITDKTSAIKIPLIIANANSCFRIIANNANELPNDRDPQSPIKISAGYELNHKNPRPAPTSEATKNSYLSRFMNVWYKKIFRYIYISMYISKNNKCRCN